MYKDTRTGRRRSTFFFPSTRLCRLGLAWLGLAWLGLASRPRSLSQFSRETAGPFLPSFLPTLGLQLEPSLLPSLWNTFADRGGGGGTFREASFLSLSSFRRRLQPSSLARRKTSYEKDGWMDGALALRVAFALLCFALPASFFQSVRPSDDFKLERVTPPFSSSSSSPPHRRLLRWATPTRLPARLLAFAFIRLLVPSPGRQTHRQTDTQTDRQTNHPTLLPGFLFPPVRLSVCPSVRSSRAKKCL